MLQTALPDAVWMHVASFLPLPLAGLEDCRAFARLALVSRPLYVGMHAARERVQRSVRVVALQKANDRFSTDGASDVLVLVLAIRSELPDWGVYQSSCLTEIDWQAHMAPFVNLVRLDLSRLHNKRAPAALEAASLVCRHVRALALPDLETNPSWPIDEPSFQTQWLSPEKLGLALRRWRTANGGLLYLSVGRSAYGKKRARAWVALIAETCPSLEELYVPDATILCRKWTTEWSAFWRACPSLRRSNCAFPVCNRQDLDQFAVAPRPRLTHLTLSGFNFAWVVHRGKTRAKARGGAPTTAAPAPALAAGGTEAMELFARTVPSLRVLGLEARPLHRLQPLDLLICHALTQCPRLESVSVAPTTAPLSTRSGYGRTTVPSTHLALVTPRGLLALAGHGSVDAMRLERVAIDPDTLGALVQRTLECRARRPRVVQLRVVHLDRDVLAGFLDHWRNLQAPEIARLRLTIRVTNEDAFAGPRNRALDEREVREIAAVVAQLSLRVELRTPKVADFVSDRSGFVVAAIALDANARCGDAVECGVFVDGTRVRADPETVASQPAPLCGRDGV